MRPMSWLKCLAVLSLGVSSACTLRPFYRQVLPPEVANSKGAPASEDVTLRVVEPGSGRPIAGARVLLTTNRGRFNATSDANGLLRMPVTPELFAENPLVEMLLPSGVSDYALEPVKQEPPPPPPPPVSEPSAPPPPAPPSPPSEPTPPVPSSPPQG